MKYWPMTAVLLAFWLGRQTSADGPAAPAVSRFDKIECRELIVREDNRAQTVRISPAGVAAIDRGSKSAATHTPSGFFLDSVLSAGEVQTRAKLVQDSKSGGAGLYLFHPGGKSAIVLNATDSLSNATLYDSSGQDRVSLSTDRTMAVISLADERGKKRIGVSVRKDSTGETAGTISVLDAEQNPLMVVPR